MITIAARLAAAGDLTALGDLRWRLQTGDAADFDASAKANFVATFAMAAVNRDPSTQHFVGEKDGHIVAAMTVRRVEKIPEPAKSQAFWGYLTNCYVLPAFRDKSAGSALLQFVRRWAKDEGLEMLVVWPSDRAYPFYERQGFRRDADPLVLHLDGG